MPPRRDLGRGERVLPGLWRLRLPLPWPGIPHCNAWAIAKGKGFVLVDTGMYDSTSMQQLERSLHQVKLELDDTTLVAITHAHSDHWGQSRTDRRSGPGARCGCTPTTRPSSRTCRIPTGR